MIIRRFLRLRRFFALSDWSGTQHVTTVKHIVIRSQSVKPISEFGVDPTHVRAGMHFDVRVSKCYGTVMVVKPSRLRANLYRLLDRVLRTGEPIEIDRGGKKLLIVPKEKQTKLNNLVRRDVIVGDPEDLVHLDWSKEWRGDLP
jgi:hypothetical protein